MQAKQYLKELKRLDTCINQKLQEKSALYTHTGTSRSGQERVQASGDADRMPDLIQRIVNLEAEINRQIDTFVDLKHQIINQIQTLESETFLALLFKRYVEFKSLEQIAVEMHYTYPYVRKLHGYALREFQRVWEDAVAAYETTLTERGDTKEHPGVL